MSEKNSENERLKYVSFEILDELIRVTDTKAWLGLAATICLILLSIIWLFFGKVASKVPGSGMLINVSGIEAVSANSSGRIEQLNVEIGGEIKKGQPVAYISQIEILNELSNAKQKKNELQIANQQKEAIRLRLESQYNEELNILNYKMTSLGKLLKKGFVLEKEALETKLQITDVKKKIEEFKIERINDKNMLSLLDREVNTLDEKYKNETNVVSLYDGRIIEFEKNVGSIVNRGETLFTLESSEKKSNQLEGIIFVSALEAKKIEKGMSALIMVSSIKPEEYGSMVGRVKYISSYPVSTRGMMRILHNEELVKQLLSRESQVEVHIELIPDHSSFSQYQWTLKKGPPIQIQSGTLCDAKITVKQRRPIEFIVPKIRKILALEGV